MDFTIDLPGIPFRVATGDLESWDPPTRSDGEYLVLHQAINIPWRSLLQDDTFTRIVAHDTICADMPAFGLRFHSCRFINVKHIDFTFSREMRDCSFRGLNLLDANFSMVDDIKRISLIECTRLDTIIRPEFLRESQIIATKFRSINPYEIDLTGATVKDCRDFPANWIELNGGLKSGNCIVKDTHFEGMDMRGLRPGVGLPGVSFKDCHLPWHLWNRDDFDVADCRFDFPSNASIPRSISRLQFERLDHIALTAEQKRQLEQADIVD